MYKCRNSSFFNSETFVCFFLGRFTNSWGRCCPRGHCYMRLRDGKMKSDNRDNRVVKR